MIANKTFDDFIRNINEFLAYFRIPYQNENIVSLKKIYCGLEELLNK